MIYFEFAIARDPILSTSQFTPESASFMFDSTNPAECTRRAAMLLRAHGLRAVSVKQAHEGYTADEFPQQERIQTLFERAQASGMSFCLDDRELAELPSEEMV